MKLEELDKKIAQLAIEKEATEKIQRHILALNKSIEEAKTEIKEQKDKFYEESHDVNKLENNDLRRVFKNFLGQEDGALEHEKQEMLWAYMSFIKAKQSLELLEYEKSVLVQKLVKLEYNEKDFNKLLRQKEKILSESPKMRIKTTLIDHKLNNHKMQLKEIDEVLIIAKELKALFKELRKEIKLITNWNQAAMTFYGKGHYSSSKKKYYVDRNLKLIPQIVVTNDKLKLELNDLKKNYEIDFTTNLTLLNSFFVLFLDNLITDWVVRNGIESATKIIEMCMNKLGILQMMVGHEKANIKRADAKLKRQREAMIIKGENK